MQRPEFIDTAKAIDSVVCLKGGGVEEVSRQLSLFSGDTDVGFDIETAVDKGPNKQIRPYGRNPKILSVAISDGERTIGIGLDHPQVEWSGDEIHVVKNKVRDFLFNFQARRIAHNLSYELEWYGYFYGSEFLRQGLWGDTMAQAYLLGVPPGALSLDSLCLRRFGISMKSLVGAHRSSLQNEDIDKVLVYNGLDSFFTKCLHDEQCPMVGSEDLDEVYEEQIRRVPTLVLTQLKGLVVDQETVSENKKKLSGYIREITEELGKQEDIQRYETNFRTFNPGSDEHCRRLFRDMLNRPEGYRGEGNYSTDKAVLDKIGTHTAKLVSLYREYAKLQSTYIREYQTGGKFIWPDGKIHTSYNSCFVATRRLSSSSPNMQNAPKRGNAWIRAQFTAPEGHSFVACDYGQIEARVVAMASEDEEFVKALWNRYDIHMAYAEIVREIYPKALEVAARLDPEKDPMKNLRQETKNKFVFPALYGAGAYSISENFGLPMQIVEELLEEFWHRFAKVKKWQNGVRKEYRDRGYVRSLTGFKRYEPLEAANAVINSSIQGGASDIVVDAMNRLSEHSYESGKEQFQPVLNVHDDLSFYIPNDTIEEDLDQIITIMLSCEYDFVNVPLLIEAEVGPDWYNLDPVGEFSSDEWLRTNTAG